MVEETFRVAAAHHAPMEPHACVARWDGDALELWTGTQTPFNLREDLSRVFGLPEERIRVVAPAMGGSFGAKTFVRSSFISRRSVGKSRTGNLCFAMRWSATGTASPAAPANIAGKRKLTVEDQRERCRRKRR